MESYSKVLFPPRPNISHDVLSSFVFVSTSTSYLEDSFVLVPRNSNEISDTEKTHNIPGLSDWSREFPENSDWGPENPKISDWAREFPDIIPEISEDLPSTSQDDGTEDPAEELKTIICGEWGDAVTTSEYPHTPKQYCVQNSLGVEYYFNDEYFAEGNFGLAYFCRDAFGVEYVLKFLKTNRSLEEVEADWEKEKTALFEMSHPNIIRIIDAFVYEGYYYLIMEKAEGTIRNFVSNFGNIPNNSVIDIGGQILSGLNHVHSKNIIHRDLHIDNILYCLENNGKKLSIKIADFGISKKLPHGEIFTGSFIGRDYDYAPELLTQNGTTKSSDLYQIGLILYFCVTGQLAISVEDGPVEEVTTSGLAARRAREIGTPLGEVIGRLLEVDPWDRFHDCVEVWAALKRCLI